MDGDDLVYRAGATRGCWVIGLLCLEVDTIGWIGLWLASASLRVASLDCKDFTFWLRVLTLVVSFFFSLWSLRGTKLNHYASQQGSEVLT